MKDRSLNFRVVKAILALPVTVLLPPENTKQSNLVTAFKYDT